jgi:CDP-diacylglycerol--glycerol-3-phosphate 3-phosphatidyltransferase
MANLITLARFPLLIIIVLLLYTASPALNLIAVAGLGLLILLDSIDGIVARSRREESLLGSVLDIMADRAVELVLWIVFADLLLVPVAIPIIYVLRSTVVDSLRSVHVSTGQAPFKAMRTGLGKWLVGSPFMRTSYALSKLISFTGLAMTHALILYAAQGAVAEATAQSALVAFNVSSWISVAFCLARGIPVVVESVPWLRGQPLPPSSGSGGAA